MNKTIIITTCILVGLTSSAVFSKKKFPTLPNPVIYNGIIYQADQNYNDLGKYYENMGIIKAIDLKSIKELWRKQLYKIKLSNQMEADVQMVFITEIQMDTIQNVLIIKNEDGNIYHINLTNNNSYQIIEYKQ
jgi:hypothetical protein